MPLVQYAHAFLWFVPPSEIFSFFAGRTIGHGSFACAGSGKCELCVRDDYFLSLEKDAKLEYLGCLGLEDQLQPLVPETIAACLRANIKGELLLIGRMPLVVF